jgi:hypothetical protein
MLMALPGLERLMAVCRQLDLEVLTEPPASTPPVVGSMIGGVPLDPVLAAFYSRFGRAMFAVNSAGMGLFRVNDSVNELEDDNQWWRKTWQQQLALPLFTFGGWSGLAWYLATVPGVADANGFQPVVFADAYDEPYALPVASNVDCFFDAYSRYLEALVAHPYYAEDGSAALTFPWRVPEIIGRDARLVEMLRAGRFEPLLKDEEMRAWVAKVVRFGT